MNDIKTIYNKINNSNSSVANYGFALNPEEDLVQVDNNPNDMECEISESEFEDAVNCYLSGGNVYIQIDGIICGVSVIGVNSKYLLFSFPSATGNKTIELYVNNGDDSGSGNSDGGKK